MFKCDTCGATHPGECTCLRGRAAYAVDTMLIDASDRAGLDGAIDALTPKAREEIRRAWTEIIVQTFEGAR